MSLNKSNIDYLRDCPFRDGYTLNIVTGCKHWAMPKICAVGKDCYAYNMVTKGRLKGHPSYPYGFEPTFHPERIRAYGGKDKIIFVNDMGDAGGDWDWIDPRLDGTPHLHPQFMAREMVHFANLNPQHIILLLTKNPSWYRLAEWPPNVWCGFSATNNEELAKRCYEMGNSVGFKKHVWISLEPWLDEFAPNISGVELAFAWLVIGGLSGPNARSVSEATLDWLRDDSIQAKRFTKLNIAADKLPASIRREYPDEWKVKDAV